MKHVPFTKKDLKEWVDYKTLQDGTLIFDAGKVNKIYYNHPFITGELGIGIRGIRTKFELVKQADRWLVENHCPCRENREMGQLCPHLVALALEALRVYTDPQREDKIDEEKRRAEKMAKFDKSDFHMRDPNGVPAKLHFILKKNWKEHLRFNRVPMRCSLEIEGKLTPINLVPKDLPLALSKTDENLLFVVEEISEGPAKGKFNASFSDFINILELCEGKELSVGGVKEKLQVDQAFVITTFIQMELDKKTGEIILTICTPTSNNLTCIVHGETGWLLQDNVFTKLDTVLPGPLRAIYSKPVRIPRPSIPLFMRHELPMLENMIEVKTDLSVDMLFLQPAKPRFKLIIDGNDRELRATLFVIYQTKRFPAGKETPGETFSLPDPDDFLEFQVRNIEAEQAALDELKKVGFQGRFGDQLLPIRGEREVLNVLGGAVPRLRRLGWRVELKSQVATLVNHSDSIIPVVKITPSGTGFFEVGYDYETQRGKSINPSDIQRAINMGDAFVKSGRRTILLDIDAIETAREVFSDCAVGTGDRPGTFRMNNIHSAYVESSLNALDGIDVDAPPDWIKKAREQNRKIELEPVYIGKPLEKMLRDYQKEGVYWLRFLERSGFCGILADEMGLGKTVQTLTWLQLPRKKQGPSLIICPTSLVVNWAEEVKKFTPDLTVLIMHGADRHDNWDEIEKHDIVITSYALIRRDLDKYLEHHFFLAVLDEAQHIKNRNTQNAVAVKRIQAEHKLVLTGTPIENSVSDLWSIMDFLMPGYLGHHDTFRKNYELPIKAGGPVAELAQMKLRRKLHPFLLRRLKKEVAKDLPDKIQRIAHCTLTEDQHIVYKQLLENAKKEIGQMVKEKGFNKSRMEIFKTLLRLRQTCCHLDLLKLPGIKSKFPSAKMALFFELVHEAIDAGHRILVFSQFTSMLSILCNELDKQELKYCYLDGSTKNRQDHVRQFNSDRSIPLFLISLKAGGTGLNLTGADMVIHFDPWWNPAVEEQATDRAHRIGQKNTVYSVKLITKNTVEEKVLQMQRRKKSVIDATIEKDGNFENGLSWKDIQTLLSL